MMNATTCDELRALIASRRGAEDDETERAIAAHLSTCDVCADREHELGALLDRYCRSTPPDLPEHFESKLLDLLCRKRAG
jgi:hypothetical protein